MIFDTHAHYEDEAFNEDRFDILNSMNEHSVDHIVCVGSDRLTLNAIKNITQQYGFVYGAYGIHPENAAQLDDNCIGELEVLLHDIKAVAVGEIGLDYYWDTPERDIQKSTFIRQLQLAEKCQKPVIIHSRDAAKDTYDLISTYLPSKKGVIHCFSYSVEMAKEYVKMGFYIGVGGVITFKNDKKLKQVVDAIPLDWLVLETDCPYLAPVPYRGKRNSSLYLPTVIQAIADIKGIDTHTVISKTEQNAMKLYQLHPEKEA